MKPRVVFVSAAGSAHGGLAAALARARFGDRFDVQSAGSQLSTADPSGIEEILQEHGLDASSHPSVPVDSVDAVGVDLVVTLCHEDCPPSLRSLRRIHWRLRDLAGAGPLSDDEQLWAVRSSIAARIEALPAALALPPRMSIVPAVRGDRGELEALLRAANLPLDGLDDAFPHGFALARVDGALAGAAGIEVWGEHALLRSVVVADRHRKQHVGEALVADRVAWAASQLRAATRAQGVGAGAEVLRTPAQPAIASVSLLTTDAERFFARLGFARIDRDKLPASLASSTQLQIPRCSTAVAMTISCVHPGPAPSVRQEAR